MPLVTSPGRQLPPDGEPLKPQDRQRQRLIFALILFLCAIGVVVYKAGTSVNTPQPPIESAAPVSAPVPTASASPNTESTAPGTDAAVLVPPGRNAVIPTAPAAKGHEKAKTAHVSEAPAPTNASTPGAAPTVTRTVLPPLAVEVFAGGRPVPLQTNPAAAVHVDTSNGVRGRATTPESNTATAGAVSGSGRVRISAEALQVLSHPVDPNYPLLAREMKVQGSVILDALISRDGTIQALKIVSGPTILATAAMEAVRQWRFKPYLQAGQAVETEARITVNFTISTT